MSEENLDGYQRLGKIKLIYGFYPQEFNLEGRPYQVEKITEEKRIELEGFGTVYKLRIDCINGQFEILNPEGTNIWHARRLGL